jgi:hypothetical protein
MACELLTNAQALAAAKGLDTRQVFCPPDFTAVCTGEGCLTAAINDMPFNEHGFVAGDETSGGLDSFMLRLERTAEINGWLPR